MIRKNYTFSRLKKIGDPRLGELMISRLEFECLKDANRLKNELKKAIGLIFVACDEGVKRNNGRPGASEGPGYVKELLPHFGSIYNCELGINLEQAGIQIIDYETINCSLNLEDVHNELSSVVQSCLFDNLIPFSIGGGNDQSWANGSGWIKYLRKINEEKQLKTKPKLAIINIDAHLDVRPMIPTFDSKFLSHSGSPFRQLIEFTKNKEDLKLIEFAAQGHQCSFDHVNYVKQNNGEIIWLSELNPEHCDGPTKIFKKLLKNLEDENRHIFFSFDIDSIKSSDCPGVSCPSPIGLTSNQALDLCYLAGQCKLVDLIDISEFNPLIESSQTTRMVVSMIYYFLLGLSKRSN